MTLIISRPTGGKLVISSASIVTSGLVLNLDAGNPASYPINGTTWTDISGNGNNGTLVNGPTYSSANGGYIAFDGTNDYVSNTMPSPGSLPITFDFWINSDTSTPVGLFDTAPGQPYVLRQFSDAGPGWLEWWPQSPRVLLVGLSALTWTNITIEFSFATNRTIKYYRNGNLITTATGGSQGTNPAFAWTSLFFGNINGGSAGWYSGKISTIKIYNRALSAAEVLQNYNALKGRFARFEYEKLTYTASGNLAVTGNGSDSVDIFKTSGGNAWDNQAYSLIPFTAPCTIEFNKQAASGDNGASYAMIGWNADPLTNASYTTLDYASFPYRTDVYSVYHNSTQVHFSGSWSTSNKFYVVYGTDGTIKHYNGSTLLYSVNYGTGNTVYVDSSFYSPNAFYGGFSNIKVIKSAWNGTTYVG